MTEPTIDEMLAWLDRFDYTAGNYPKAIRAILEQQKFQDEQMQAWYRGKENEVLLFRGKVELEAIRAFVERVQARAFEEPDIDDPQPSRNHYLFADRYLRAFKKELAAMEKETK